MTSEKLLCKEADTKEKHTHKKSAGIGPTFLKMASHSAGSAFCGRSDNRQTLGEYNFHTQGVNTTSNFASRIV